MVSGLFLILFFQFLQLLIRFPALLPCAGWCVRIGPEEANQVSVEQIGYFNLRSVPYIRIEQYGRVL